MTSHETAPVGATARGLEAARLRRAAPFALLAAAVALLLALTSGTSFYLDELSWFALSRFGYAPSQLLLPYNSHLILLPRLLYLTSLHLFGPAYLPFRIVEALGVAVCGYLFYVLARRRVGPSLALIPTTILVFLCSSWGTVVSPVGIPYVYALAGGLGAFVAIERNDRRGDIGACACLVFAVATHTFGLFFLLGVAVYALLDKRAPARAWIFVIPLALYFAWWALASHPPGMPHPSLQLARLAGGPSFVFRSLDSALPPLIGLDLHPARLFAANRPPATETGPVGAVFALAVIAALVWYVARRRPREPAFWAFLAVPLSTWVALALAPFPRTPMAARFLFPWGVMVLLVAVEAARARRPTRVVAVALVALTAFSVAVNVLHGVEAHRFLRAYARDSRAVLAMVELADGRMPRPFYPARYSRVPTHAMGIEGHSYLQAVRRFGSPAATLKDVRRASPLVRRHADAVLARALGVRLVPAPGQSAGTCASSGGPSVAPGQSLRLPPGGAVLTSRDTPVTLELRRFAPSPSVSVGRLARGESASLQIPADRAADPWSLTPVGGPVRACGPPASRAGSGTRAG